MNKYFLAILIVNLAVVGAMTAILMQRQDENFNILRQEIKCLQDEVQRLYIIAHLSEDYTIVSKKIEITAYTSSKEECSPFFDGKTATNIEIKRIQKLFGQTLGVIAVDFKVIPKGTLVIVPRMGVYLACDQGGKIKGDKGDLLMNSKQQAHDWGRRVDYVLLLKPRKPY